VFSGGVDRHPVAGGSAVIDAQVGLHVFMIVLIFGTLWRLLQFHAMASPSPWLNHLGKAMAVQY
jgi:hypothetical protein